MTADGAIGSVSGGQQTELERLRAEVERSRNRLGSSLAELERRVSVGTNWRHWVRTHPWAAVSLGLGAGYLVGKWRSRGGPVRQGQR
jgi:ElaB/YqjD/DUF883 family membrane-anchored ribosome-binding protein